MADEGLNNALPVRARPSPTPPAPPMTWLPAAATEEYVSWTLVTGLVRRRWRVLAAALVVTVGLAVAYLAFTPPTYEAGASLLVEEKTYNLPELVKNLSTEDAVSTQVEVLRSVQLKREVARELGLRLTVDELKTASPSALTGLGVRLNVSPPRKLPRSRLLEAVAVADSADTAQVVLRRTGEHQFSVENLTTGERQDSVAIGQPLKLGGIAFTLRPEAAGLESIRLRVGRLEEAAAALDEELKIVRPDRNVNVIFVRYRSPDPELAGRVPDLLADRYIANRVDASKARVRTAMQFLRGQSDTLHQKLLTAEEKLRDFRRREGIVSLQDEATSEVVQSADLRTTRTKLEAERSALDRLMKEADATDPAAIGTSPYRRLTAFPTLINNPVISELLGTLSKLENERSDLLMRRTPADPDAQANAARIAQVDAQLRSLTQTYLAGLQNQVASFDGALGSRAARASRIPTKSMEEERLSRNPRVLGDVYSMVQTRLQEARIAESAADPGVTVIDRAGIPDAPVWPRTSLILAVAIAAGLMVGGAGAWMREGMDEAIHTRADVVRAAGAPLLGLVPHIRVLRGKHWRRSAQVLGAREIGSDGVEIHSRRTTRAPAPALLLGGADPSGVAVEAYAWLETSLGLAQPEAGLRTVAFTSPLAREGKTINAANLAISIGRRGTKVLLVDADLRRGTIHQLFGISRARGLADVLSGTPLGQAIRSLPLGGGTAVHVLPRGEGDDHPSTLLRSGEMRGLLEALENRYELVILDLPPVNLVSDPLLIASMVDGVVLVARAGVTDSAALAEAARHLREANAPLLGVVLNDIDLQRDRTYDEAYRYLDEAGAYATVGEP